MAVDLISILVGGLVLFIFYAVLTFMIREGIELIFRPKDNNYFQASEISLPITLFLLLQLILGDNLIVNIILAIMLLIMTFIVVRKNYTKKWRSSVMITLFVIACIVLIFMAVAFIVYKFI